MYKVLARKYRPSKLDEVIGQPVAVQILRNAIKSGKVHHAILLSGPMGTGKTSLARIISKSLNCDKGPTIEPCGECEACKTISVGRDVDVLEIDGASNRRIEDARAIIESVKYPPLKRRFKIYIIDEVHMLTQEAFNALLKTIEEPPEYVKFIFATTAIEKVPDTILSRCQILTLRKISQDKIEEKLKFIAKEEGLDIEDEALALIAYSSLGSLRVAEGYLDRCISYKPTGRISKDDVSLVLGISTISVVETYVKYILEGKISEALNLVNRLESESKNLETFLRQVLDKLIDIDVSLEKKTAFLNIFYTALVDVKQKIDPINAVIIATYKAEAANKLESVDSIIDKLSKCDFDLRLSDDKKTNTGNLIDRTENKDTEKHLVNSNNVSRDSRDYLDGVKSANESKVDKILQIFGGKIINIEKLRE